MNHLKSRIAALFLTAAIAFTATAIVTVEAGNAQSAPAPVTAPNGQGAPHAGHPHMKKMLESLNLSASQKTQIDAIMASTKQKNENADPQTRQANKKAAYDQINGILTPAQRTQLQGEMQAARAQYQKNGAPGAPQSGNPPQPAASP